MVKIHCFRWFINEIFEFRVSFYGLFSFILRNKLRKLLRYNIIQTLVVLGNIVDVAIIADGLEVTTGTFYIAFLRTSELGKLMRVLKSF